MPRQCMSAGLFDCIENRRRHGELELFPPVVGELAVVLQAADDECGEGVAAYVEPRIDVAIDLVESVQKFGFLS